MLTARVNQNLRIGVTAKSSARNVRPVRFALRASTKQATTTTEAPAANQQEDNALPAVDFTPNTAASSGFVQFDTAGQTNMFPVPTSAYEVPAGGDTTAEATASNNIALIAGGLALAVIGGSLGVLTAGSGSDVPSEQLLSLTQYAAKFATEL